MNDIADELDPIWDKIKVEHDAIALRARRWLQAKEKLLPFCKDMIMLGADVSVDRTDINFRLSGDKEKFLKLVRLHRRHGFKPTMPEKGATTASWFVSREETSFWVHFTSTVCHRVQVGTRTEQVPVYETRCDSFVPSAAELEDAQVESAPLIGESDVPF